MGEARARRGACERCWRTPLPSKGEAHVVRAVAADHNVGNLVLSQECSRALGVAALTHARLMDQINRARQLGRVAPRAAHKPRTHGLEASVRDALNPRLDLDVRLSRVLREPLEQPAVHRGGELRPCHAMIERPRGKPTPLENVRRATWTAEPPPARRPPGPRGPRRPVSAGARAPMLVALLLLPQARLGVQASSTVRSSCDAPSNDSIKCRLRVANKEACEEQRCCWAKQS